MQEKSINGIHRVVVFRNEDKLPMIDISSSFILSSGVKKMTFGVSKSRILI